MHIIEYDTIIKLVEDVKAAPVNDMLVLLPIGADKFHAVLIMMHLQQHMPQQVTSSADADPTGDRVHFTVTRLT